MHTERVTFLTTAEGKATIAARAAARGVSVGEYIRRRIEDEDELTTQEEAELAALVQQVNEALPHMHASIDAMIDTIRKTREDVDSSLRQAGFHA